MKAQMAHPSGTMATPVGDSKPGIRPIRLQNRMKKDDGEKRRVGFAVVADNFVALVLHESFDRFEGMLQPPGDLDRKPRAHQKKEDQQKREDEQLHGERIRNGRRGILGLDVEACAEKR